MRKGWSRSNYDELSCPLPPSTAPGDETLSMALDSLMLSSQLWLVAGSSHAKKQKLMFMDLI